MIAINCGVMTIIISSFLININSLVKLGVVYFIYYLYLILAPILFP
jgi:hypothetical protein